MTVSSLTRDEAEALLEDTYFDGSFCDGCANAGEEYEHGEPVRTCYLIDRRGDPFQCPGVEEQWTC